MKNKKKFEEAKRHFQENEMKLKKLKNEYLSQQQRVQLVIKAVDNRDDNDVDVDDDDNNKVHEETFEGKLKLY